MVTANYELLRRGSSFARSRRRRKLQLFARRKQLQRREIAEIVRAVERERERTHACVLRLAQVDDDSHQRSVFVANQHGMHRLRRSGGKTFNSIGAESVVCA